MKVALIGWRGMVGSVLLERMRAEGDLKQCETQFFSTSNAGGEGPQWDGESKPLGDAYDIKELKSYDVILTCQGGSYTEKTYPALKAEGWQGYWIDAASTLRMADDSVIILDPVNRPMIDEALRQGKKSFVGGNCTVSLMLMALNGLFKEGHVEWLSSMTYQAASGAGAANMKELVAQANYCGKDLDPALSAVEVDAEISRRMKAADFPKDAFGQPLAYSLLPYIDREVDMGQSREEWKGISETNKILGSGKTIPIDGLCVRVGSLRCHSQAFTIKLNSDVPMDEIETLISEANEWVELIPNTREASLEKLSPAVVSGSLNIPVGRLRKMHMGPEYLSAFSVGDQLLWGAAEPLRRMLVILKEHLG